MPLLATRVCESGSLESCPRPGGPVSRLSVLRLVALPLIVYYRSVLAVPAASEVWDAACGPWCSSFSSHSCGV